MSSDEDDVVFVKDVEPQKQAQGSNKRAKIAVSEAEPILSAACELSVLPEYQFESFQCPICIDLLFEPVVLACSHEFCKTCIEQVLHSSKSSDPRRQGSPSCPSCRSTFSVDIATLGEGISVREVSLRSLHHGYSGLLC